MEYLTLGSLFDGSGGFPLAGAINGITPVWASEIEPYPIRVTKARFPNMKHLGSVLDVKVDALEPVDIITFGSPCQDLSVAGKQLGIHAGERSNLFFEAVRIAKEMRNHDRATGRSGVDVRPRFLVWENVPGAFSSNQGEDFRSVLEALGGIAEDGVSIPRPPKGKWQHAGCVVGDGWSIAWRLYDAQYWGVPQRRKRIYLIADLASERAGEILFERESLCGYLAQSGEAWEGIAGDAQGGAGGSCFFEPAGLTGDHQNRVTDYSAVTVYDTTQITSPLNYSKPKPGDACHPLAASQHPPLCVGNGQMCNITMQEISNSLDCMHDQQAVLMEGKPPRKYIVRRLTPLECCRLQGFPDWWEDGVEGSDSARYKMWGNGIALPCAVDVLRRIAKEL
jgi:DNA (cytosine-5)-methyltransferase 1